MRYILDGDKPADVDSFLIITFTRAAAEQLRSKIAAELGARAASAAGDAAARARRQNALLRAPRYAP